MSDLTPTSFDNLTLQFSDLDLDMPTPDPTTRHHTISNKGTRSITAECLNCAAGTESMGFDEQSSRTISDWMTRHEMGA